MGWSRGVSQAAVVADSFTPVVGVRRGTIRQAVAVKPVSPERPWLRRACAGQVLAAGQRWTVESRDPVNGLSVPMQYVVLELPRDREVVVFARVNANARVQEPFDVKISHLETYIGKGAARLTPAKASANTAAPTVRA